jgi:hypothetical protein
MIVTAWNNGSTGYGLKLQAADRDHYFRKSWQTVLLQLDGWQEPVEVNVGKPSFWNGTCRELISHEIGRWLKEQKLASWPKNHPPKLVLEPLGEDRFSLRKQ